MKTVGRSVNQRCGRGSKSLDNRAANPEGVAKMPSLTPGISIIDVKMSAKRLKYLASEPNTRFCSNNSSLGNHDELLGHNQFEIAKHTAPKCKALQAYADEQIFSTETVELKGDSLKAS